MASLYPRPGCTRVPRPNRRFIREMLDRGDHRRVQTRDSQGHGMIPEPEVGSIFWIKLIPRLTPGRFMNYQVASRAWLTTTRSRTMQHNLLTVQPQQAHCAITIGSLCDQIRLTVQSKQAHWVIKAGSLCNQTRLAMQSTQARYAIKTGSLCNQRRLTVQSKQAHWAIKSGPLCNQNRLIVQSKQARSAIKVGSLCNENRLPVHSRQARCAITAVSLCRAREN